MRAIKVEYMGEWDDSRKFVARMKDVQPKVYERVSGMTFEENMHEAALWYLGSLAEQNPSWAKYDITEGGMLDEDVFVFIPVIK